MNLEKRKKVSMPKEQLHSRRHQKDKDGNIIVNMTIKNDDDFLSVYSTNETPVIATEVAEFIENSTYSLHASDPLTLRIYSDCIDDQEKIDYRGAIKEYYAYKYLVNQKELKRNGIIILLLTIAGIITLAFAFRIDSNIWSEVVDIAAWVFLWEAVDIGVFRNRDLRLKRKRYLSYMSMKLEYHPLAERSGNR